MQVRQGNKTKICAISEKKWEIYRSTKIKASQVLHICSSDNHNTKHVFSNENAYLPNDIMCPLTPGALGVLTEFPVLTFTKRSNTYFSVPALLAVSEAQCQKEEPCLYGSIVSVTCKRYRSTSIRIMYPVRRSGTN